MDEPTSKHYYVLQAAWEKQLLRGMPQTIRQAFNAGYDFGFSDGIKKGKRDSAKERQTRILGT